MKKRGSSAVAKEE
jgi:hypothetical protein